jgi:hypothetical protein
MLALPAMEPIMFSSRHSEVRRSDHIASLNADGTLNWFIPPYVIPTLIILLVAVRAIHLS